MNDSLADHLKEISRQLLLLKGNKRLRLKDQDLIANMLNYNVPTIQGIIKGIKEKLSGR